MNYPYYTSDNRNTTWIKAWTYNIKDGKTLDGGETFTPAIPVINKNDKIRAKNFEGLDMSDNGKIYTVL